MEKLSDFIIQNSIPTVFDDSLSFYELVSKLLSKTNSIIDMINDDFDEYAIDVLNSKFINLSYDPQNELLSFMFVKDGDINV